jgi:hypothetical protein
MVVEVQNYTPFESDTNLGKEEDVRPKMSQFASDTVSGTAYSHKRGSLRLSEYICVLWLTLLS